MRAMIGSAGGSVMSNGMLGITTIAANLILLPFVFSAIGTDSYGIWLLLIALATYVYQADVGIGSAVLYSLSRIALPKAGAQANRVVSSSLVWMIVVSLVAIPIFLGFAFLYRSSLQVASTIDETEWVSLVALGSVLVGSIWTRLFSSILQATGNWVVERLFQMVGQVIRILGTILVIVVHPSIVGIAVVEAVALLVPGILAVVRVLRDRDVMFALRYVSIGEVKSLLRYSIKSFTVSLTSSAILQAGPMIAGALGGPTHVSIYTAAARVYGGAKQVLSWLIEPFVPVLSRVNVTSRHTIPLHVLTLSQLSLLGGALISGTLFLLAPGLVSIWLGDDVDSSTITTLIQVFAIGLIFNASHLPSASIGNALGRPGAFLTLYLVWAVAGIGAAIYLGVHYGVIGVAVGMNLPLLVLQPIFLLRMKRVLNLPLRGWFMRAAFPGLGICAFSACASYILALSTYISVELKPITAGVMFALAFCILVVSFRKYLRFERVAALVRLKG